MKRFADTAAGKKLLQEKAKKEPAPAIDDKPKKDTEDASPSKGKK